MTGIFVTARLGSTRLAQKHLINVLDKPFIKWLVEKFLATFKAEIDNGQVKIFITTSVNPENKTFEQVFAGDEVSVFYGSDANIPLRHLECAEANNIKYIIAVDGDDILCSSAAAREVLNVLEEDKPIVQTKGLPLGMNIMGYSTEFLRESLKNNTQLKLETGWGKIFENNSIEVINFEGYENASHLRMTLDYEDDAFFFTTVINEIGEEILTISDNQLVERIMNNNWQQLNISLNEEYWNNFNKQKQQEN